MISRVLRWVFFAIFVRFVVLIIIGLNIRRRQLLPEDGPAILVANHNSHLDTLVLMSLLPLRLLPKIRPVAAADYFLKNKCIAWFAQNIIGIIPLSRSSRSRNMLEPIDEALARGDIVIFYPEGTRGEPEAMGHFKSGIQRIAENNPDVPICPIYLYGLGKALPKGESILVPFFCDVWIGKALNGSEGKQAFAEALEQTFQGLEKEAEPREWS